MWQWKLVFHVSLLFIACEQALEFRRAKRAARERPQPSRVHSCASRASAFLDIPQIESLLARYTIKESEGKGGRRLFERGHLFVILPWGGTLIRGNKVFSKTQGKQIYARASMYISEARK